MNVDGSSVELPEALVLSGTSTSCPLARRLTSRISPLSPQLRGFIRALPATEPAHRHAWSLCDVFDAIEMGGGANGGAVDTRPVKIAFWNAERCKYLDASAELVRASGADVLLMAEADRGMARSGNQHTARALAERLGWYYVWGVEFVELGLGDRRERQWHQGETNTEGLHGNAILSRFPLRDPALVRLSDGATWFAEPADGQRRVGGRMGLAAKLRIGGRDTVVVAVHIESRSSPEERAHQIDSLLQTIDIAYGDGPVIVGGDFNTCTLVRPAENTQENRAALAEIEPSRFASPIPFEPLFEIARVYGYAWEENNLHGHPTQRTRRDGTPAPPLGKLDWFLTRDIKASDPSVVAATSTDGEAISDHDMIEVVVCSP